MDSYRHNEQGDQFSARWNPRNYSRLINEYALNSRELSFPGMARYSNQNEGRGAAFVERGSSEISKIKEVDKIITKLSRGEAINWVTLDLPLHGDKVSQLFYKLQKHETLSHLTLENISDCHCRSLKQLLHKNKKLHQVSLTFQDACPVANVEAFHFFLLNNPNITDFGIHFREKSFIQQGRDDEQALACIGQFGWHSDNSLPQQLLDRLHQGFGPENARESTHLAIFYRSLETAIRIGAKTIWFEKAWLKAKESMPHLSPARLKKRPKSKNHYLHLATHAGNLDAILWLIKQLYNNDPTILLTLYETEQKNAFVIALEQDNQTILASFYKRLRQDMARVVKSVPSQYQPLFEKWVMSLPASEKLKYCFVKSKRPFKEPLPQVTGRVFDTYQPGSYLGQENVLLRMIYQSNVLSQESFNGLSRTWNVLSKQLPNLSFTHFVSSIFNGQPLLLAAAANNQLVLCQWFFVNVYQSCVSTLLTERNYGGNIVSVSLQHEATRVIQWLENLPDTTTQTLLASVAAVNNLTALQNVYRRLYDRRINILGDWQANPARLSPLWNAIQEQSAYPVLKKIIDPENEYTIQNDLVYHFILQQLKSGKAKLVKQTLQQAQNIDPNTDARPHLLIVSCLNSDKEALMSVLCDYYAGSTIDLMWGDESDLLILATIASANVEFCQFVLTTFCHNSARVFLNFRVNNKHDTLFHALRSSSTALIKWVFTLHENTVGQAALDQVDAKGNTLLLHYLQAQSKPNLEILNYLIARTSYLMHPNHRGDTVLKLALQKRNFEEGLLCLCESGVLEQLQQNTLSESDFRRLMRRMSRQGYSFPVYSEEGNTFCHQLVQFNSPLYLQIFLEYFPEQQMRLFEKNKQGYSAFAMEQAKSPAMRNYLKQWCLEHFTTFNVIEKLNEESHLALSKLSYFATDSLVQRFLNNLLSSWQQSTDEIMIQSLDLSHNLMPSKALTQLIEIATTKMPRLKLLDLSFTLLTRVPSSSQTRQVFTALIKLIEAETSLELLRLDNVDFTDEQYSTLLQALANHARPFTFYPMPNPRLQTVSINRRAHLLAFQDQDSVSVTRYALPAIHHLDTFSAKSSMTKQLLCDTSQLSNYVSQTTYQGLMQDEGFKPVLEKLGLDRMIHVIDCINDIGALFAAIQQNFVSSSQKHCLIIKDKQAAIVIVASFVKTDQVKLIDCCCHSSQPWKTRDRDIFNQVLSEAADQNNILAEAEIQFQAHPEIQSIQPIFYGALKLVSEQYESEPANQLLSALRHTSARSTAVQVCVNNAFVSLLRVAEDDINRFSALALVADVDRKILPSVAQQLALQAYPLGHELLKHTPKNGHEAYNSYSHLIRHKILPVFLLPETEFKPLQKKETQKIQLSPLECYQFRAKRFNTLLETLPTNVETETAPETVQSHFQKLADGFFEFCAYGITGREYTQQTQLNQLMFACLDAYRQIYQATAPTYQSQTQGAFSPEQRYFQRHFLSYLNSVYMVSVVTQSGLIHRDRSLSEAQNYVIHITEAVAAIAISTCSLMHCLGVFLKPVHHAAEKVIPQLMHGAGHFLETIGETAHATAHTLMHSIAGIRDKVKEEPYTIPQGVKLAQQIQSAPNTIVRSLLFNTSKHLEKIFLRFSDFGLFSELSREISLQLSHCYQNQFSKLPEKDQKKFAIALALHVVNLFGSGVLPHEKEIPMVELVETVLLWVQHVPMASHGNQLLQTPYGRVTIDQLARGCGISIKIPNDQSITFFNVYQETELCAPLRQYLKKDQLTYPEALQPSDIATRQMIPVDFKLLQTANGYAVSQEGAPSTCLLDQTHPFAKLVRLKVQVQEYAGIDQIAPPKINLQSPSVKIIEHEGRLTRVEADVDECKRRLEVLEETVGSISSPELRDSLENKIRELKACIDDKDSEISELKHNANAREDKISQLEDKVSRLTAEREGQSERSKQLESNFTTACTFFNSWMSLETSGNPENTNAQRAELAANFKRWTEQTLFSSRRSHDSTHAVYDQTDVQNSLTS